MWEEDATGLRPTVVLVPRGGDELWLEVRIGLLGAVDDPSDLGRDDVVTYGPLYAVFGAETYADITLPDAIDGRFTPVDVLASAISADTGQVVSRRGLHALAYRGADGVVSLVTYDTAAALAGIAGVVHRGQGGAEDTAEDGAAGLEVAP